MMTNARLKGMSRWPLRKSTGSGQSACCGARWCAGVSVTSRYRNGLVRWDCRTRQLTCATRSVEENSRQLFYWQRAKQWVLKLFDWLSNYIDLTAMKITLWRWEKTQNNANTSGYDGYPANRQQPNRPFMPTPIQNWHPQEKKHRDHEKWYWCASTLLTLAVAIGAGVSAVYAYTAAYEAKRQANAADTSNELSNRAWLIPYSASVLHADANGFAVEFTTRNIGKEPAQNVEFSKTVMKISALNGFYPIIEEDKACDTIQPLARGSSMYADIDYKNDWTDWGIPGGSIQKLRIEGILRGIDVISLQNCIAYISFNRRRTTQICWYLVPDRDLLGEFKMLRCPQWNRAE